MGVDHLGSGRDHETAGGGQRGHPTVEGCVELLDGSLRRQQFGGAADREDRGVGPLDIDAGGDLGDGIVAESVRGDGRADDGGQQDHRDDETLKDRDHGHIVTRREWLEESARDEVTVSVPAHSVHGVKSSHTGLRRSEARPAQVPKRGDAGVVGVPDAEFRRHDDRLAGRS